MSEYAETTVLLSGASSMHCVLGTIPCPEQRPPNFDEALEHHARSYLINALLAGLNWRLNLIWKTVFLGARLN